ncbi:recombinase family protein [Desulfobotulus mexicanus]|uniref:Resolvase n=1 Tax=Desulfobotulus mexicanus TaxID=2586642 RepID=A0A5S5MBU0_9BACT|nr:recombinase family protein [Desulfobotulus mexicanus]TYT73184.1 resolvase [Desulfobotulus mexicanus]
MVERRVYGYLRASTADQDASRAKDMLDKFASENGVSVAAYFIENESGAKLYRPELFRALGIMQKDDVLLIEQVDRLSRLNADDWQKLRVKIQSKGILIVSLDLPFTHSLIVRQEEDKDFQGRVLDAVMGMMLDVLAAVARKDFEDRRRRQMQGIARAKLEGKYGGRKRDSAKREKILALLGRGLTYSEIEGALGVSRRTIARTKAEGV